MSAPSSYSSRTWKGGRRNSSSNGMFAGVPGIRQRTSRPSRCVSLSRTPRAASHSWAADALLSRRCMTRTLGLGSHVSRRGVVGTVLIGVRSFLRHDLGVHGHALPALAPVVPAVAHPLGIPLSIPGASGVALTFDDGPHPEGTPAGLEVLAQAPVAATVVLVGEQVQRR